MKGPLKRRSDRTLDRMFETRSDAWAAVGLNVEMNKKVERAAWRRAYLSLPAVIAVFILQAHALSEVHNAKRGHPWLGFVTKTEVRAIAVLLVLLLGWLISRDVGRLSPKAFRRMDPSDGRHRRVHGPVPVRRRHDPRRSRSGGNKRGRRRRRRWPDRDRPGPRRAADARQPVRGDRAAQCAAVPSGRTCPAAGRCNRDPVRASSPHSACCTRRSHVAMTGS